MLYNIAIVSAHPHVFITAEITPRFTNETLEKVDVKWAFDEFFSAMILLESDADKNLVINGKESNYIYENAFIGMADFDYGFVVEDKQEKSFKIPKQVSDFKAMYNRKTRSLEYTFSFDLAVSISDIQEMQMFFVDESYYIDYSTQVSNTARVPSSLKLETADILIPNFEWGDFIVSAVKFTK